MCGICGITGKGISHSIEVVRLMDGIRHRGPDAEGKWSNDSFALGHLRLSIIDLSDAGIQPMTDEVSGNRIVFNGEIYNYLELKELLKNDYPFKTSTDTEVILASYLKFGRDFLSKLRGMFALALYDASNNQLLLARDRVGIKPLYYRKANNSFYFSSEIKNLVDKKLFKPASVNDVKASEFLYARQLDCDDQTLFQEVRQLKPGHFMVVNESGDQIDYQQYWDLQKTQRSAYTNSSNGDIVARMDETTRLHLRSDVPVGSFVSGGIDSSAVTCFALRNLPDDIQLQTFSAVLPEGNEENRLIPVITGLPRVVPYEFQLDGVSFFDDIEKVIYHHDEPLLDGSMYSHYKLCEMAHQRGIKVLLSGAGGDELFGGYLSHVSSYLAQLLKEGRLNKYRQCIFHIAAQSDYKASLLLKKSLQETLPFNWRRNFKTKAFTKGNSHIRIPARIRHFYYEDSDPWFSNLVNNYRSWTVPPYLHYEDRNSMAFGIEVRVPFYDHELMEYIFQINPDRIINGRSKSLMREAFDGIVPSEILSQKGKYGFPSPIDELLQKSKRSKELYFDLVPNNPFFNKEESIKLGERFFAGQADLGKYWRALSFSIWHSIFFHG